MATSYDALRVTSEGKVTDLAIVVPEYTAKALPLHQLFKSFPSGPTGERQVAFFHRAYAEVPAFSAELEKNNVVPVFLATGYPVAFLCTETLDSLNDLAGHTWRSASFWHQDFLRHAGATPATIPWGDPVFQAMRDRTLDGLMVNVDSALTLKIPAVAPHVLLSKDLWLGHLYVLAMNRDKWNGLTPEDQAAIGRAAETAYTQLGRVMDQSFDAMVSDLRKTGATVRLLTPEEVAAWQAATGYREVQAAWVKDQQSKGVPDAAPVLEKLTEMLSMAAK